MPTQEEGTPAKTVIRDVRVFDGNILTGPTTVIIDGDRIGADETGAQEAINGGGGTVLPGLIDAHVHLHGRETLEQLCSWGITTALDMATWPPELVASLRGVPGLTDIRSPGAPALGERGAMPAMSRDTIVQGPEDAGRYVEARVSEGADYIKIILEDGGLDQATTDAIVAAAHARGKQTVIHAVAHDTFEIAVQSGTDIITHMPLGPPLGSETVQRVASTGQIQVPTLTMMEGTASALGIPDGFAAASESVRALYRAGSPWAYPE